MGFKKISYLPLEKISFPRFYDLRGKVHQAIKNNPLSISSTEVEKALLKLKQSTQKALLLVEGALEELLQNKEKENDPETGKMIFYQMELEEQNSYQVFLTVPNGALQLSFQRKYRPKQWKASPEEVRGVKWEYLYGKWSSFQNLLQFYLKQLEADAIKYE
ncbi:MAG: hypothetical protein HYZ47_03950 [Simkania negevensis]|nr:hypothetical protein [Simkania negevensis]